MPNFAGDISTTAFAFRGYNVTNLGRTAELLLHPKYGDVVSEYLRRAGKICSEVVGCEVDLHQRVQQGVEPPLTNYAEAVALVVGTELAQVQILQEQFGISFADAKLAYGYSLGELTAIACAGVFEMDEVLRIPIAMAADSAELAQDVTMGVLFSRGPAIDEADVQRLCTQVNYESTGTIGMSAILSPNTYLLLGQGDTIRRFKAEMHDLLHPRVHMRINKDRWPPLHTPIIWQRHITDRASLMMEKMHGGMVSPCPPVVSLVTGTTSYTDISARDILRKWIDHPQRLWDAVYETLAAGIETVIHVGPAPNLIPATFHRLSQNVQEQISGRSLSSLGLRAVSGIARRPWLASLMPSRTALLRAPTVHHVILEDWLLAAQE